MFQKLITVDIQNNIPIFHFRRVTPVALDDYMELAMPYLHAHIEKYSARVPFCYVVDLSESGMFPVKLMMDKAKKALESVEIDPVHYIAYVIEDPRDEMLVSILNLLAARKLSHTRKVFTPDQMTEAVSWLKEMEAPYLEKEKNR